MAFFKIASAPIVATSAEIANIEYAPEALKIKDSLYGEELVRRMAEILPLKTDPENYLYVRNWAISSLEKSFPIPRGIIHNITRYCQGNFSSVFVH